MQQLGVVAVSVLRQQWTCIRHTPEHTILRIRTLLTFRQIVKPENSPGAILLCRSLLKLAFVSVPFWHKHVPQTGKGKGKKTTFTDMIYICTIIDIFVDYLLTS
jgi:hypothetical protein